MTRRAWSARSGEDGRTVDSDHVGCREWGGWMAEPVRATLSRHVETATSGVSGRGRRVHAGPGAPAASIGTLVGGPRRLAGGLCQDDVVAGALALLLTRRNP